MSETLVDFMNKKNIDEANQCHRDFTMSKALVDGWLIQVAERLNLLEVHYTKREAECIFWLAKGKTAPEIGLILGISPRTIEKFIASIKNKLGCYTLFQLGQKISSL